MNIGMVPGFRAVFEISEENEYRPMLIEAMKLFNLNTARAGPDAFGRITKAMGAVQIVPKANQFGLHGDPEFAFVLRQEPMSELDKLIHEEFLKRSVQAPEEAPKATGPKLVEAEVVGGEG